MHPRILEVTQRLVERSRATRERYLQLIRGAASDGPMRASLQCANFAHGVAGCGSDDKQTLRLMNAANVAIVSAYNDMLSAHQPYQHFPEQIKQALRDVGSVGQFAGGVPAMCDGVTQGEPGMELAIASREVIAMSTAVALSHNMFDAALGTCRPSSFRAGRWSLAFPTSRRPTCASVMPKARPAAKSCWIRR